MMLSACAGSGNSPVAQLPSQDTTARIVPELSSEDARACYDPGVPDGVSALEIIADTRVALGDCKRRHARVVTQYNQIKGVIAAPDISEE
ncbi:MAG: hypothetical protein MK098_14965 [Marinovum sp.]|nr:hypothetical protein [Marinovum sp.]